MVGSVSLLKLQMRAVFFLDVARRSHGGAESPIEPRDRCERPRGWGLSQGRASSGCRACVLLPRFFAVLHLDFEKHVHVS